MSQFVVCALYKFVALPRFETLRQPLYELMLDNNVRGTLLLATEGINGTVAGRREDLDVVLQWLRDQPEFATLDTKVSFADSSPFKRTRVKLKKEIVTMGVAGIEPERSTGTYVSPLKWNALISDPEVLVIDTRNDYEVQVGTFEGALNPETDTFREFPAYVKDHLDPSVHRKIAMFCTGGIRCEKSTAYLKQCGFEEVFHLQGGILNYLEHTPAEESLWHGECFVFDDRVTVTQELAPGSYDQCHACRRPITENDKRSKQYTAGVSCPHCISEKTSKQKRRFAEREKQMQLARGRGQSHIGADAALHLKLNRARKRRENDSS